MQMYIDLIRTIANKQKISTSDRFEILMNLDILEQELDSFTRASQVSLHQSKKKEKTALDAYEDVLSSIV